MHRYPAAIAALLAAALLAAAPAGADAAPRWQTVPGVAHLAGFAWAAGRVWFVPDQGAETGPVSDRVVVRSARTANGRLGSWVTARLENAAAYLRVLGEDMIYSQPDGTVRSVRLLPDGTLGEPAAVVGAPAQGPPPVPVSSGLIRLPDRAIWIGAEPEGDRGELFRTLACCDLNGAAVDYSTFIPLTARVWASTLGFDGSGRLWFVWAQGPSQPKSRLKIIELDPATLLPRTSDPAPVPLPRFTSIVNMPEMPCPDACYLVTESSKGRASLWSPGESSPTRIPTPTKSGPGYFGTSGLFAANIYAGHLVFAYWSDASELGVTVRLARGDARGALPRLVRSIEAPQTLGPFIRGLHATGTPYGVLWPGGLVAIQAYDNFNTGKPFLRAAILALGP